MLSIKTEPNESEFSRAPHAGGKKRTRDEAGVDGNGTAELERLAAVLPVRLPAPPAEGLPAAAQEALLRFMKSIAGEVERLEERSRYYTESREARLREVEALEEKIGRVGQRVAFMAAQSSAHTEKLRKVFQQVDLDRKEHIKMIAEFHRKLERVENSIKLVCMEQERLKKFGRKTRV